MSTSAHTRPDPDTFRPPLVSLVYSAAWAYAAYWLYIWGQRGVGWATFASLVAGGMALGQFLKAGNDQRKLKKYRDRQQKFKQAAASHGTTSFASHEELKQSHLATSSGVFLGAVQDKWHREIDLRYNAEGSGSIISPPGGGKTAACFTPTLLTDPSNYLVNDPTLELYAMTHEARRKLNNDVVVLCPWPEEASAIVGHEVIDTGINFLSSIDYAGNAATVRENVKSRIELLIPERLKIDAKTEFFERDGRNLLEFLLLDDLSEGRIPTLPRIRERLLAGPEVLHEAFLRAMDKSAFAGELALLANGLSGVLSAAPQQFAGSFGTAAQGVELFDGYSSVFRHTSGPGFDPRRFKSGRNVTVYVCFPGERIRTHQRLAAATFSYLFQQICQGARGNGVTALIDEAAELGYCPFIRYMNIGRKFNLRVFCAWQELHGQVQQTFGVEGVRQIMSASDLLWITAIRGHETCELISKTIGMQGLENLSLNEGPLAASLLPDQSLGRGHLSVPLCRPEAIQRLPHDRVLILQGNMKPVLAKKVPYFMRPSFLRAAGPNPYRG